MKTFILMWNPAISSYTWERFKNDQKDMCENMYGEGVGNWSVWEHEKAEEGDRFFMVKVGEGKTGIVMAGTFWSSPYEDEDWSGKGRKTYYADLRISYQVDPDLVDIITTEELYQEIPDFEWKGGHSGRVLDKDAAEKLELMWLKYLNKVRCIKIENAVYIEDGVLDLVDVQLEVLKKIKGETCEVCGYNYKKVFGDDCEEFVPCELHLSEEDEQRPMTDEEFFGKIHCVCDNCRNVDSNVLYRKLYR